MTAISIVLQLDESEVLEIQFKDELDVVARIEKALGIIWRYSQYDGGHHKAWVIDQAMKALLAEQYDEFIEAYRRGEDGPHTYEWIEGIPP